MIKGIGRIIYVTITYVIGISVMWMFAGLAMASTPTDINESSRIAVDAFASQFGDALVTVAYQLATVFSEVIRNVLDVFANMALDILMECMF